MPDNEIINASPTAGDRNSSLSSCRKRSKIRRSGSVVDNITNDGIRTTSGRRGQFLAEMDDGQVNERQQEREELLFHADRLDCMRARQEINQRRILLPATNDFITLEQLVLSQKEHEESTATSGEMHRTEQHVLADLSSTTSVVQTILRDFCSSPTYVEEEVPTYEIIPYFRYRDKKIRTYSRQREVSKPNEDDRLSVSSGLSMQEDSMSQRPASPMSHLDGNSTRKIFDNLLNLSAYLSQGSTCSSSTLYKTARIDIPNETLPERDNDSPSEFVDMGAKFKPIAYSDEADIPTTFIGLENSKTSPKENGNPTITECEVQESKSNELSKDWYEDDSSFFENFESQKILGKTTGKENEDANTPVNKKDAMDELQKLFVLSEIQLAKGDKHNNIIDTAKISAKRTELTDALDFENMALSEWQLPDDKEFQTVSSHFTGNVTVAATPKEQTLILSPVQKNEDDSKSKDVVVEEADFGEMLFSEWQPEDLNATVHEKTAERIDAQQPIVNAGATETDDNRHFLFAGLVLNAETSTNKQVFEAFGFRTASDRSIGISKKALSLGQSFVVQFDTEQSEEGKCEPIVFENMSQKPDTEDNQPNLDSKCGQEEFGSAGTKRRKSDTSDGTRTPNQKRNNFYKAQSFCFETPQTTQKHSVQLSVDKNTTKEAVIKRMNLSLTKRRKLSKTLDPEAMPLTPIRPFTQFAPTCASTSTPQPNKDRQIQFEEDLEEIKWNVSKPEVNTPVVTPAPPSVSDAAEPMGVLSSTPLNRTRRVGLRRFSQRKL